MGDIESLMRFFSEMKKYERKDVEQEIPVNYAPTIVNPSAPHWGNTTLPNSDMTMYSMGSQVPLQNISEIPTQSIQYTPSIPTYHAEVRLSGIELEISPAGREALIDQAKEQVKRALAREIMKSVTVKETESFQYDGVLLRASFIGIDSGELEKYVQRRIEEAIRKYRDDEE